MDAVIESTVRKLGYTEAKHLQTKSIKEFVSGNDVFVSVPTGYGKTVCYACLPLVFDKLHGHELPYSVIIVISPLKALMKEQVLILKAKGLSVMQVSGDSEDMEQDLKANTSKGRYQVIYTSPEILLANKEWSDVFQSPALRQCLVGVIINEAHCIKKWGKQFRKEFSRLGEIRAFLSTKANIMALTATATKSTRKEICKSLGMIRPVLILLSPEKNNIIYKVSEKIEGFEETFAPLVEELHSKRTKMEKTIIFCRTYDQTSHIYLFFKYMLGQAATEPIGFPNISKFRIIDMFTACTTNDVKDTIISSFTKPDGRLRIVVATIAFGMGLNCPNVRRIIHWGPPSDTESYIQETGRAGRDGDTAHACLYYAKREISGDLVDGSMKAYCINNTDCRRHCLFSDFDTYEKAKCNGCKCCDICASNCCCISCQFQ